jgi:hypothetical protein
MHGVILTIERKDRDPWKAQAQRPEWMVVGQVDTHTSIGRGVVHVQLQSFCYLHPDND